MPHPTRRRFLFGALGLAAAGGAVAWFKRNSLIRWALLRNRNEELHLTAAPSMDGDVCVLTADQVEGPFFVAAPHRADLREDRRGRELHMRLQLVRHPGCAPLAGAVVEIWQCDADGVYSGYPEELAHDLWRTLIVTGTGAKPVPPLNERRFLRGAQVSDADGRVTFTTVFPGWYEPRAPHIHFKIIADGRASLTSQFYFDTTLCDRIYRGEDPYRRHGPCPFTPENDVAMSDHQHAAGLLLNPAWRGQGPLEVSARIGLRAPA